MNDRNDGAALEPRTKQTIIATYLEMAEANRELGYHDLAAHCTRQADALSYGGSLTWWEAGHVAV